LKKGDGARDLSGRVYSTPCSIAITASTRPAVNAPTNMIGSGFTGVTELAGSKIHPHQDPRYFLNQPIVAGQAARAAVMFAPFIPLCCRRKPCPAPG